MIRERSRAGSLHSDVALARSPRPRAAPPLSPRAAADGFAMLAPRDNHLDKAWSIVFQLLHGRLTLDDIAKQIADASGVALQARVDGLLRQVRFTRSKTTRRGSSG